MDSFENVDLRDAERVEGGGIIVPILIGAAIVGAYFLGRSDGFNSDACKKSK